jgi:hypothetical protein
VKRKTVIANAAPLSALLVLVAALAPLAQASVTVTGVLSTGNHTVAITSTDIMDESGGMYNFPTPDWQGSAGVVDTFVFDPIDFPPAQVDMTITGAGMPNWMSIPNLKPDTWYIIGGDPEEAMVMFSGWMGGVEEHGQPGHRRAGLTVSPSIVGAGATIRAERVAGTSCAFEFYDVAGNRVRTLRTQASPSGAASAAWTGEDDLGRGLPEGIYYCCLADAADPSVRKLVLTR